MESFGTRFGALVKRKRGNEGLTQQALAAKALDDEGAKSRISELENRRIHNPQQKIVDALIVALNLSPEEVAACHKPHVPGLPEGFVAGLGLTDELVEALSWGFGDANPRASATAYQDFLREKAAELARLQARVSALGKSTERISNMTAEAQSKIERGRFDEADEVLRHAEEMQQVEHTLVQVRKQAEIRAARAETALLGGDATKAHGHFESAASYYVPFDPKEAADFRRQFYISLYQYALRFDYQSMQFAIDLAEKNTQFYHNAGDAYEEARTENNVSAFMEIIATYTSGKKALQIFLRAIEKLESVLRIHTENKYPKEWGRSKLNIGNILYKVGERIDGADGNRYLKKSISAHKDSLRVRTHIDYPEDWADTKISIGNAFQTLGYRTPDPEGSIWLARAAEAYEQAMSVHTNFAYPERWAMIQNNCGSALEELGNRVEGIEGEKKLRDAAAAYKSALSIYTQVDFPLDWAMTQNNFGGALTALGSRMPDPEGKKFLEEACTVYYAALEVYNKKAYPLDWARVQENLGVLFDIFADRLTEPERTNQLQKAIKHFNAALTVYDPEIESFRWIECTKSRKQVVQKLSGMR